MNNYRVNIPTYLEKVKNTSYIYHNNMEDFSCIKESNMTFINNKTCMGISGISRWSRYKNGVIVNGDKTQDNFTLRHI